MHCPPGWVVEAQTSNDDVGRSELAAYLRGPVCSAEVSLLLGGLVAMPGGECAPDASSGFDVAGVTSGI